MTQFPVPTKHSIVVGGYGSVRWLEYQQGAETGVDLIRPGDLVRFTNAPNDCTVKAGTADSQAILGVARIHPVGFATPPRGSSRANEYEEGDTIEIVSGPITVMLRIEASQDIQCGEMVQPAASGQVKAYICGTDNDCQRIAQALETITVDTTAFSWGMFQLRMG